MVYIALNHVNHSLYILTTKKKLSFKRKLNYLQIYLLGVFYFIFAEDEENHILF